MKNALFATLATTASVGLVAAAGIGGVVVIREVIQRCNSAVDELLTIIGQLSEELQEHFRKAADKGDVGLIATALQLNELAVNGHFRREPYCTAALTISDVGVLEVKIHSNDSLFTRKLANLLGVDGINQNSGVFLGRNTSDVLAITLLTELSDADTLLLRATFLSSLEIATLKALLPSPLPETLPPDDTAPKTSE